MQKLSRDGKIQFINNDGGGGGSSNDRFDINSNVIDNDEEIKFNERRDSCDDAFISNTDNIDQTHYDSLSDQCDDINSNNASISGITETRSCVSDRRSSSGTAKRVTFASIDNLNVIIYFEQEEDCNNDVKLKKRFRRNVSTLIRSIWHKSKRI